MEIKTFNHEMFGELRTVLMNDGQIGFVGKDVAKALGYSNAGKAIMAHVEDEDKMLMQLPTHSQNGNVWRSSKTAVVTESGLYSLVLSSKKPEAKEFKRWVTSEVLVQIRMTGSYSAAEGQEEQQTILLLRKAVQVLERSCELKDEIIDAQRLKVEFANAVSADTDLCTLAELAKLICNAGVPIGQNRLCEWMREQGYLCRSRHHWNTPYQQWIDQGLFMIKIYKKPFVHRGYTYEVVPMVTAKGQEFFVGCFIEEQRSAA